jgi:hypothetical protein
VQRRRFLVSALLSLPAACAHGAGPDALRFAVLGDAPYGAGEEPEFGRVIDRINADPTLRFAVHVGDIKAAAEVCSDALISRRRALLERLSVPWLYTPGDNEWTDCHHRAAGRFNPLDRLRFVRRTFFADPARTHGPNGFAVGSQSSMAGFGAYVENQRFALDGIVFATVHMVGSDNGLAPWRGIDSNDRAVAPRKDRVDEVRERTAAVLVWIDAAFDRAQRSGARAVVLFFQANPEFERAPDAARRKPFNAFLARIHARAAAFGKPVLLAHGDGHWYTIDRPFADLPAVVRLQVPGSPFVGWVNVTVRAGAAPGDFFEFERGTASTRAAP